jgi:hypothetical protein
MEKVKAAIELDVAAHPFKSLLIMAGTERPQEHTTPEEEDSLLPSSSSWSSSSTWSSSSS